jgi:hypothetical protein
MNLERDKALPITHIHTYLVHPAKGLDELPGMGGAPVDLNGKTFDLLKGIYDRSDNECDIDISFNRSSTGAQQNPCRDLLLNYVNGPTLARGRRIAERLAKVTTHRSHLGLLFLIVGTEGLGHKAIISRFPADSGILAEENSEALSIEFLERIFMKSAKSYKAVLYKRNSPTDGFWTGKAVDKQLNNPEVELSGYWITEFLDSDFRTTSAAGTRRLAVAIAEAAREVAQITLKSELVAAATLAAGFDRQRLTIRSFANQVGLSQDAKRALFSKVKPATLDENFQLSAEEFIRLTAYRTVELDTGGLLIAETKSFERVFQKEVIDQRTETVRYSAEGKIVSEKVGKSK